MLSRLRRLLGRENGESPETRERQKEADLQSPSKTRSRKWFERRHRAPVEPLTHQTLLPRKQVREEIERLTTELQLVTSQRDELRDRLLFISEGMVDNRPYHEPNRFYEKLKLVHKQVMTDVKIFENENTEASMKYSELSKEIVFYRGLHSRLLMEHNRLSKKMDILRQETKKHLDELNLLKNLLEDLSVVSEDNEKETSDLKTQQQQDLISLEARLQFLLKQTKMVSQANILEEKLQHHFEGSQTREEPKLGGGGGSRAKSRNLQPKLEQALVQNESHLEKEALQ